MGLIKEKLSLFLKTTKEEQKNFIYLKKNQTYTYTYCILCKDSTKSFMRALRTSRIIINNQYNVLILWLKTTLFIQKKKQLQLKSGYHNCLYARYILICITLYNTDYNTRFNSIQKPLKILYCQYL